MDVETAFTRYIIICVFTSLAAQVSLYLMFTTPYAFYTDTFTTAAVQNVLLAAVMNLFYRMCFQCPNEKLSSAQKLGVVCMVSGFIMATSYRLPIPLLTSFIAVLSYGSRDAELGRCAFIGVVQLRAVLATAMNVGAAWIIADAIQYTRAGQIVYNEAKNSTAVCVGYIFPSVLFFLGTWIVSRARSESMHTGALVNFGITASLPLLGLVFLLSLIPGVGSDANTKIDGPVSESEVAIHWAVISACMVLKGIILACMVESIKIGELFSYTAFSGIAYMVFAVMIATQTDGAALPPGAWLGSSMILLSVIVVTVAMSKFNVRWTSEDNKTCLSCGRNKTFFCSLMWAPHLWCDKSRRSTDSSFEMQVDVHDGDDDDGGEP